MNVTNVSKPAQPHKCGNCHYLVPDHSHPETNGNDTEHRRGWACTIHFATARRIYSGWSEEGYCAGWEKRTRKCIPFPTRR
ncbi:MAG: hypothetical protein BroJett012_06750 [Betaproteobacteria bacterium]|nr:MAG: hypothetical protein BroJett012_06750 [Betaproteobacteria bacterium]